MKARRLFAGLAATAFAVFFAATPALADDVLVRRDVTVREDPVGEAEPVDFVTPGDRLDLLDGGTQRNGYYHVRLPDGREGWIYRSFVRRVPDGSLASLPPPPPPDASDELRVHYIDVDQGAAALLEFPCAAILIDAGGRGDHDDEAADRALMAYLDSFFERRSDLGDRLAAVFITHTHVDHNTGLERVAQRYGIGGYIHNGRLFGSGDDNAEWMLRHAGETSPPIRTLALKDLSPQGISNSIIDPVACSGIDPSIRVLSGGLTANPGWSNDEFTDGNNHSLVIRVDYGQASFLFTGDLPKKGLERLAERNRGTPRRLDVDVWQVSHHGAENAMERTSLAAFSPEVAVISMGRSTTRGEFTAAQHGHPRKVTVEFLDAAVSRRRPAPRRVQVATGQRRFEGYQLKDAIYGTGWDGDVVISADRDGTLRIATSR